LTTAGF